MDARKHHLGLSSYRATFSNHLNQLVRAEHLSDRAYFSLFAVILASWLRSEPVIIDKIGCHSVWQVLEQLGFADVTFSTEINEKIKCLN